VQYADTDLYSLRERHKVLFIELVAESYAQNHDLEAAKLKLEGLQGPGMDEADVAELVARAAAYRREGGSPQSGEKIAALASALGAEPVDIEPAPTAEPEPTEAPPDANEPTTLSRIVRVCLILLFVLLIAVGLLLVYNYVRRGRNGRPRRVVPSAAAVPSGEEVGGLAEDSEDEWSPAQVSYEGEELELGHFVTTFELGDDGYDESFGIETETGEFLGECGVAISEVIGSGVEKPVAFDIWLFDKSDIRTVTTVVASEYAYQDEALRAKLGAKGDVVLATPGQTVNLQTATLTVKAEIIDLDYGAEGDLPDESFFEKFTVELSPGAIGGA
jgi:hypothetical protein